MKDALISPFTDVYENRHALARNWRQEGKRIFGYAYSLTPEELLYAAGIIPVHLTEGGEEGAATATGEVYLPEYFCDYVHSVLGQVAEGVYDYLDGVIIPEVSVPLRALAEVWEIRFKLAFFFYLNCPAKVTPGARRYFREELLRLKKKIEDFSGSEVSEKALASAIKAYNENRALLNQVYQLREQEKSPLSGSEFCEIVKAGLVSPKEEHNRMLRGLLEHLPGRERKSDGRVRLMVSTVVVEECAGTPNFLRVIEEMGGEIVCDDLILGHRYFREPTPLQADLMEALVDRYLGKVPVAFKMPAKIRAEMLLQEALKHKVKGAIFFLPKYCQSTHLQMPYIGERFKEKGIATLVLESTAEMPEAPLRTRLQAFLEMLL